MATKTNGNSPATKKRKISEALTSNVRVTELRPLLPPAYLEEEIPINDKIINQVEAVRADVANIINGKDDRLLVIVGPCSIHDVKAAKEYATKLAKQVQLHSKDLLIVMRVYFEKPRTTVGWKGLINDPDMNGSFNINKGLRMARQLLIDINSSGVGVGTEFLDSISPQFTADLIAWGAIGARTTESQIHRELASGLSAPIGFKNGTGGNVQVAVDAIGSAKNPHSFLGVTEQGLAAIVSTSGNPHCHIILRGGSDGPNYEAEHIKKCEASLKKAKIDAGIMVDCSHGNSKKDHKNQPKVVASICEQVAGGSKAIAGVMIESNLNEGKQSLSPGVTDVGTLKYGVSVTDACIDWKTTENVLKQLAEAAATRRKK